MTRVLLADVARAAGVSIATASRALAGRGDLRPDTRARVLDAAAALGYIAGGRRGRDARPRHLDLVLRGFGGSWASEVTTEIRAAAAARGLDLVLTEERDEPSDDWPGRVCQRGSRGVVLGVIRPTAAQLAELGQAGVPIVLLEPRSDDVRGVSTVRATDAEGAAAAADHLLARGAEHLAVAVSTPAYRFGRARVEGFTARVRELRPGVEVVHVAVGSDPATARRAFGRLFSESGDTRLGVFASTDETAVHAYHAAAEARLEIPGDVLVVGFDDVPGSATMLPPLTTVHQPIRRMAERAVDLLLNPPAEPVHLEAPTTLVVRAST